MSLVALKNVLTQGGHSPLQRHPTHCMSMDERKDEADELNRFNKDITKNSAAAKETLTDHVDLELQDATTTQKRGFHIDARVISDATIGLADGLTVPFALTAGLSALGNARVVIFGGLAELIAGAISMGLGGYLGAKCESASYVELVSQTKTMVHARPDEATTAIRDVFVAYHLPPSVLDPLAAHLSSSPSRAIDFLVRFGPDSPGDEPSASRALTSALTIAAGYFFGGLIPLLPYFAFADQRDQLFTALYVSISVMVVALFVFGYAKTCFVIGWKGARCLKEGVWGGVQMVIVGGAAACAAMGLVKAFNHVGNEMQ